LTPIQRGGPHARQRLASPAGYRRARRGYFRGLRPWSPHVQPAAGLAAAVGLALVFLAQVYFGSLGESLTWDEPGYIAAGYANWVWGDYRLNADHPPLMQKLQGLPLLFMDLESPEPGAARYLESPNPRPTYGRDLVFFHGNDVEQIARWGRAPVMLLGALLVLCIYG